MQTSIHLSFLKNSWGFFNLHDYINSLIYFSDGLLCKIVLAFITSMPLVHTSNLRDMSS